MTSAGKRSPSKPQIAALNTTYFSGRILLNKELVISVICMALLLVNLDAVICNIPLIKISVRPDVLGLLAIYNHLTPSK